MQQRWQRNEENLNSGEKNRKRLNKRGKRLFVLGGAYLLTAVIGIYGVASLLNLTSPTTNHSTANAKNLDTSISSKSTTTTSAKKETTTSGNSSSASDWTITNKSNYIKITVPVANVRVSPSTNASVLEKLTENTIIKITREAKKDGQIWYGFTGEKGDRWISSDVAQITDSPNVVINTPVISQLPELPRGCEVTSLAMLLNQAGVKVDKMTLAQQIKKVPFHDGSYIGNPNDGFVGDIYNLKNSGLGVYHGPVADLAKNYLGNKVDDMTGQDWSAVEKKLDEGHAVWVIINSTFKKLPADDPYWYNWSTREGPLRVTYKEHSVLVTGYGPDTVFANDPLSGKQNEQLNKTDFIAAWKQMGNQAISY
ncbi:C39 family peptidase [Pullulanibacillus sp. KACC 23026]|uniref:C39 family peptidase n=1 Tax=Pullulanibacillus sp. KACC 23026 TaxID=3028315 RepID=UPI0023AF4363|nr:C39 family peptidase [Pullulanibacillus sp. KACC 23026]WEG13208.1 C39 family peptidase [Pullulanibacillus sp. KACC 23026]